MSQICCVCFMKLWEYSRTIQGWWHFHPPFLPPLHSLFSYFVSKQLGFFLQKLSLQQPTGTRATLQIADGSLSSRVRTRDEITLGIWAQGWSGGGWLLDDKHTEPHICAHNRVQKDMTQNNTSICVLSSFRLSGLVIALILGHTYSPRLFHILSKAYAHSGD